MTDDRKRDRREYCRTNKEKFSARSRKWYWEHREECQLTKKKYGGYTTIPRVGPPEIC